MGGVLKGKKILVTGGCGFIGSHIVDRLLKEEANVVVLDNLETGKIENISHNLKKIKFIQKDFMDENALEEAFDGVEYISHQAALRSVPKSVENPYAYHHVNVTGTLKLFLKAKEKKIKRIVVASSSSVYGERTTFPERETDVPCPISPYAASKLFCEHYGYIFSKMYGLNVVALRYFNVFGPRQSLENQYAVVVPKFITALLHAEQPPIYGDGNQERDFTYVDNVVEANVLALTAENAGGEVFNVASAKPYSVNFLLETLKEIMDRAVSPHYLPLRSGDVRKTHGDIEKIQHLLGWRPVVDFREGLRRTVSWFEQNQSKTK